MKFIPVMNHVCLRSPDIEFPSAFPLYPPPLSHRDLLDLQLSPPQDVPDISDFVNCVSRTQTKQFNTDFELSEADLNIVNLQTSSENEKLHLDVANIRPSEPQPPEIELVDMFKKPTFKMKQLEEMIKDEVVSLFLHKSFPPTESDGASNIFSLLRLLHFIIFIPTFWRWGPIVDNS